MAEPDRVTASIAAYWNERSATYDDVFGNQNRTQLSEFRH